MPRKKAEPEQVKKSLMDVFKSLTIPDALSEDKSIKENAAAWWFDFANKIFNSVDENGAHTIKEYFLLIPKKNGKSILAAAIMLTYLIKSKRYGGELIIIAPQKDVADNSFRPICDMIAQNNELSNFLKFFNSSRLIHNVINNNKLQVLAANPNAVAGTRASIVLFDELHLLGNNPAGNEILTEATGGLASKPDGFVIYLTTQSDKPPAGIFAQKLAYARKVASGEIIDPTFYPLLFEFTEEEIKSGDAFNPENWQKINPNMGYSVSRDFLERAYKQAELAGGEQLQSFYTKHLNIQADKLGSGAASFLHMDTVDALPRVSKTNINNLDLFLDNCSYCAIGIDGGGMRDIASLAIVGKLKEKNKLKTKAKYAVFCASAIFEKAAEYQPQLYSTFDFLKQNKQLKIFKNNQIDKVIEYFKNVINKVVDKIDVVAVGGDDFGGVKLTQIKNAVGDGVVFEPVPQGIRLGGAIQTLDILVNANDLFLFSPDIFRFSCQSATLGFQGESVLLQKVENGHSKIDPLIATCNALYILDKADVDAAEDDWNGGLVVLDY